MNEHLIEAMRPVAAALARCVAARDQAGVAVLLQRRSWRELHAVAVLLAECASPSRLRAVCGACESCGASLLPGDDQGRRHAARGLCWTCYRADRKASAEAACTAGDREEPAQPAREARLEDFADLLSWRIPLDEAAARIGVTVRTAERYLAELRAREERDPVAA